jgi:hypothetical protein
MTVFLSGGRSEGGTSIVSSGFSSVMRSESESKGLECKLGYATLAACELVYFRECALGRVLTYGSVY